MGYFLILHLFHTVYSDQLFLQSSISESFFEPSTLDQYPLPFPDFLESSAPLFSDRIFFPAQSSVNTNPSTTPTIPSDKSTESTYIPQLSDYNPKEIPYPEDTPQSDLSNLVAIVHDFTKEIESAAKMNIKHSSGTWSNMDIEFVTNNPQENILHFLDNELYEDVARNQYEIDSVNQPVVAEFSEALGVTLSIENTLCEDIAYIESLINKLLDNIYAENFTNAYMMGLAVIEEITAAQVTAESLIEAVRAYDDLEITGTQELAAGIELLVEEEYIENQNLLEDLVKDAQKDLSEIIPRLQVLMESGNLEVKDSGEEAKDVLQAAEVMIAEENYQIQQKFIYPRD